MKKKLMFAILGIVLFIALVSAVFYPEPWGNNQDAGGYNITNLGDVTADNFIGNTSGNLDWANLQNYPITCPEGSFLIELDDVVTCSTVTLIPNDLNVTGNLTANIYYGEMWMQNRTGYITTVVGSQNVWYNLTGFNATDMVTGQSLNGFTYDNAAEHLTVLVAGKYLTTYTASVGNAGNNQEYEFAVAINSIVQNNTVSHRKLAVAGDVGNLGSHGFIDIIIGDSVHLMTSNKDGTADIQAHAMNLNLLRVGD